MQMILVVYSEVDESIKTGIVLSVILKKKKKMEKKEPRGTLALIKTYSVIYTLLIIH